MEAKAGKCAKTTKAATSSMDAKELGRRGEAAAAEYLMRHGCKILTRNYRVAAGEIDLIAEEQDGTLLFVEVKTRRTSRYGLPCEAVDCRKQHKIITCAGWYLKENHLQARHCRFDVIELMVHGDRATIRHHKGAFE